MSQHVLKTQRNGKPIEVLMGWDRPLQGFFLVVEEVDSESDGYLYANLDDPELSAWMGLPPSLDPFLARLTQLGIDIPARMIEEIKADAKANVGNRFVTYDERGSIVS